MTHVVIIGAGMGGIATSMRLKSLGLDVTLLERLSQPGGRSNVIQESGFRVDTGPTILVMKETFEELYQSIGFDINDRINFTQLDPNYRVYFHDQTYIDLHSNMAELAGEVEKIESGGSEKLFRFLGASAEKYQVGMPFVDRNYDRVTDLANPIAGYQLLKTKSYQNLYRQVSNYFESDKLRKAFSFHSMFLGLSPFSAPAMYSLITYADMALGMWYPEGGIYRLIEDMIALSEELGVEIHTNANVSQITVADGKATGVMLEDGQIINADIVVSNADLPYTYSELIADREQKNYSRKSLDQMNYACSGYLLYLGINKKYPQLQHQALYFSKDYKRNLDEIFELKVLPADPSFHLNTPTQTDPALAPPGHSLLYILAPMPNLKAKIDWSAAAPLVREKLIHQLEKIIDPQLQQHIVWEKQYTPENFKQDYNAVHGTAFGSLSHEFFQSSYFRPHNRDRNIQGLYFVGQGTYPGIGMPMVMISSKLVTERIKKEWL